MKKIHREMMVIGMKVRYTGEQDELYCSELPSVIFRIIAMEAKGADKHKHIKQRAENIKKMVNKLTELAVEFYCTEQEDY